MSEDDLRFCHEAEGGVRTERDLLAAVLDTVGALVVVLDTEGRIVRFNQACERATGYSGEEVLGRCFWDFLLIAAEVGPVKETFHALRAGAFPNQFENRWVAKDGSHRLIAWTNTALVDPVGAVEYVVGTGIDITGRRQAEEERDRLLAEATRERQRAERLAASLEAESHTLRVVIEATHTQLAYLDAELNFLLVNSAYAEGSGHTREELIGCNHFALFPNAENQVIFQRVRDTGEAVRFLAKPFEFAGQPERGVTYWDWSLVPVRGATGQVQGLVLSLLDVTQQVESRQRIEALSAQSQRQADELTAVLNAIPESVAVWGVEGGLLRANPASAAFGIAPVGVRAAALVRQVDVRTADGKSMAPQESVVARALRGETTLDQTEIMIDAQGERREIRAIGAPVRSGGEIVAAVVVTRDVTERRRAEAERERLLAENRAQREFLERLVESAPVGIAVLRGAEHRYELANPYYRSMTGAPDRPIVGRTIVEAIPDLVSRRMPELMDEVYRSGQPVSTREAEISIGPGREQTYWDTDRVPLRNPDGQVDGILVLAREVTRQVQDRKRIEALSAQALRQAGELEAIVAALVEPMLVFDAQGAVVRANPAAVAALEVDPVGLPEGELARRVSARHPDGRPIPADELVAARALRGEQVYDAYQTLLTAGGKECAIVASAAPIVTGDGVSGAVVAWHDITDLRQAEAALRESEEKLRSLFELMPLGISILDKDRRVTRQNAALEQILGLSRESMQRGSHVARTYLRSDGTALPREEFPSARAWKEQRLVRDQVGVVREDGGVSWLDVSAAPVPFADWKVVVATVDVTERKLAEQALVRARDELETRVRERTAELVQANRDLVAENRERGRIEEELRLSEQRLEQRVEERTHELATLLDISGTVALSLDLEQLLNLILKRLMDVVESDGATAFRIEAGGLRPVGHLGAIAADEIARIGASLEHAVLGRAVVLGPDPLIIADVQGDSSLMQAFREAAGTQFADMARSIRAWMAVPVTIKEQVYGVLYLYRSQPDSYREEQARLALAFGNQAAIAIENTRLHEQAQKLAAMEERQRLARELHDAVSQTLFSASLAADVLPRLWERDREAGLRCLEQVHKLTRGALAEMRTLLLELRPSALIETDLGALLRQLGEAVTSRARVAVAVEADFEGALPPEAQVALYRIAQEALNNVTKHAGAQRVSVGLHHVSAGPLPGGAAQSSGVVLSVTDDGCGFELVGGATTGKGLGLSIMRERARAIGADVHILSRPGEGTQIVVIWPGDAA